MVCAPTERLDVVQVAVRVFPEPESGRDEQPLIDDAPSTKLTEPVGAFPVTLAVSVMLPPDEDGLTELASVVVVLGSVTTCATSALVDAVLDALPE